VIAPEPASRVGGGRRSAWFAFGAPAVLSVAAFSGAAGAQPVALRDPTVPPPAYSSKPGAVRFPADAFRPELLVAVDGQRYLVWKGRRYGVGDSVEGSRIERLEESEVWLRTEGRVRKLPWFTGVEKGAPGTSVPPGAPKGGAQ
jgi:hypothetical protein